MQPLKPCQKMASLGGAHYMLWFRKQQPLSEAVWAVWEGALVIEGGRKASSPSVDCNYP